MEPFKMEFVRRGNTRQSVELTVYDVRLPTATDCGSFRVASETYPWNSPGHYLFLNDTPSQRMRSLLDGFGYDLAA